MRKILTFLLVLCLHVPLAHAAEEPAADPNKLFLSLSSNMALKPHHLARLNFTIKHADGTPLTLGELKEVHERKMHVLAADPALEDYQHLHPAASATPGDFVVGFMPKTERSYRFWMDITLKDGGQHTLIADLPGADKSKANILKRTATEKDEGGYHFVLTLDPARPKRGEAAMGSITVSDARGKPVSRLQPVLGAYAHIVGIADDYRSLAHMHPMGDAPMSQRDRGGPTLQFHLEPEKSGFLKLFAQFKIDGKDIFVPFGVWVQE